MDETITEQLMNQFEDLHDEKNTLIKAQKQQLLLNAIFEGLTAIEKENNPYE